MWWISKLSDMENEKIINEGGQDEIRKEVITDTGKDTQINESENTLSRKDNARKPIFLILRLLLILISSILIIISLVLFILYVVPVIEELSSRQKSEITNNHELNNDGVYKKQIGILTKDVQRFSVKFNAYTTGQSYVVINTIENRFSLYTNKKLIREGFCSSGSYTMLQTSGNKKWIFKTPKGKYWIHGKTTNPVWKRPDWSFVEEGSPIPSANDFSRYEYGVLGDYAMALGDGYMIHGTIYKRFLGMPVTHGCVRLNDEDLKVIYNTLNIGSKVYIF
jgi:lipoprotein-anchoring transpeptidase ErfK/SrfK